MLPPDARVRIDAQNQVASRSCGIESGLVAETISLLRAQILQVAGPAVLARVRTDFTARVHLPAPRGAPPVARG